MAKEPRLAFLREQLQSLPQITNGAGPALQTGVLCVAQFQLDKQWYRARVERIVSRDPVNPKYQVRESCLERAELKTAGLNWTSSSTEQPVLHVANHVKIHFIQLDKQWHHAYVKSL